MRAFKNCFACMDTWQMMNCRTTRKSIVFALPALLLASFGAFHPNAAEAQSNRYSGGAFEPMTNTYFYLQYEGGDDWAQGTQQAQFGGTRYLDALNGNGLWLNYAQFGFDHNGHHSANAGVVRRLWLGGGIVGLGAHYDLTRSDLGNDFQKAAITGEWFSPDNNWVVRGEGNFAFGNDSFLAQDLGTATTDLFFQGNNLILSQASGRLLEEAMSGLEYELARGLGNYAAEGYLGGYHYMGQIGDDAHGVKGGVRGFVSPGLFANLEVRDDNVFGTSLYGGVTLFLGGPSRSQTHTLRDQLIMPVQRHDQAIVNTVDSRVVLPDVAVTQGGDVITFAHVDNVNTGGGGDAGTFGNPFTSLTSANGSTTDIVYVHSGTTFNNQGYTLAENQRFLGEGNNNQHQLLTDQLGVINLPEVNGISGARPVIQGGITAITAAANTEISNFDIEQANRAIYFNNVNGDVDINRLLADSVIQIDGGSGEYIFSDVHIVDSNNDGLRINGGAANVTFSGAYGGSSISVTDGNAVSVQSNHSGTVLFPTDTTITATNTEGFSFLAGLTGSYTFNGTNTIINDSDGGIQLANSDGTYVFGENTSITNTGDGAVLMNLSGVSDIDFTYSGTIQNLAGRAISITGGPATNQSIVFNSTADDAIQDSADGILISGTDANVNIQADTELTGSGGIFIGSSGGTHTFADTDINMSSGSNFALELDGSDGTVNFLADSSITQSQSGAAVRIEDEDTSTLNFDGNITATNGTGLQFSNADGTYNFNGTNTLNGGDAGIDILNNSSGTFTFSENTSITDPTGIAFRENNSTANVTYNGTITQNNAASAVSITNKSGGETTFNDLITANTGIVDAISLSNNAGGTVNFNGGLDIDTTTGIGFYASSGGDINVTGTGNTIFTENGTGVSLSNVNAGMLFEEITVLQNPLGNGILLSNMSGSFEVTGTTSLASTGFVTNGIFVSNATNSQTGNITFGDVNVGSAGGGGGFGRAIEVDAGAQTINFGDVTVAGSWLSGDLRYRSAGSGGSLTIQNFDNSASTSARGISIELAAGDVTINGGTIESNGQTALSVVGGTGDITIAADVVSNSTGNVVSISGRGPTSGDINISGDVTGAGSGILVNNNSGGTTTFSGDINMTGSAGINLNNNVGATVNLTGPESIFDVDFSAATFVSNDSTTSLNFTGGNLLLESTLQNALNANGAGAINIQGTGNTIRALNDDAIVINGISFDLNNTAVFNSGVYDTINTTNSNLSGSGNTAANFSSSDGGGNTGTIQFNGGADTAP